MSGLGDNRTCPATYKAPNFVIAVKCGRHARHSGDHELHCDDCNGVGYLHGRPIAICHTCNGSGYIRW